MSTISYVVYNGTGKAFDGTTFVAAIPSNMWRFKTDAESDEDMKAFHANILTWRNQLLDLKKPKFLNQNGCWEMLNPFAMKFTNMDGLCAFYLKRMANLPETDLPQRTRAEAVAHSQCCNGGLLYKKVGTYKNVRAVDFASWYARLLGLKSYKLHLPLCEPSFRQVDDLPEFKLSHCSMIRCKITSDDLAFHKLFRTLDGTDHDWYTNVSMVHYMWLKESGYNATIELINDGQPNYIDYARSISSHEMFNSWYKPLNTAKNACRKDGEAKGIPKNYFIKQLMSSTWGRILARTGNTTSARDNYSYCHKTHGQTTGKWISTKTHRNLRIMPWLKAISRYHMAKVVDEAGFDNCVFINDDGAGFIGNARIESTWFRNKGLREDPSKSGNVEITKKGVKKVKSSVVKPSRKPSCKPPSKPINKPRPTFSLPKPASDSDGDSDGDSATEYEYFSDSSDDESDDESDPHVKPSPKKPSPVEAYLRLHREMEALRMKLFYMYDDLPEKDQACMKHLHKAP